MVGKDYVERLGIVAIEDVLPIITPIDPLQKKGKAERIKAEIHGHMVNVYSLRLKTFKYKGTKCVNCGLEATHFAIERTKNKSFLLPEAPHLNLYGLKDGEEVLFTHYHSLARGLGGKNHISNCETMCGPCNWDKGREEQKEMLIIKKETIKIRKHSLVQKP